MERGTNERRRMRGKEGEKKREKGEATLCSGYIRGSIAHKNVHAPFSYSSCSIASSFFSSSISSSFTFSSLLYSIISSSTFGTFSFETPVFAPRTIDAQEEKKKGSTPDCDRGARRRTMTASDCTRGTGGTEREGGKGTRDGCETARA